MEYENSDALVNSEWLAAHIDAPDIRIVDGTFFLPDMGRDAEIEFELRRIPGAVRFDINEICDSDTDLPHMLPSPEKFSSKVRKLGLGDGNRIIVYDALGGFCAAMRVWWMFRVFGHSDVAVLDGGLPKWMKEDRPVEDGPAPRARERHFTARMDNTLVRSVDQVIANLDSGREQIIDARSETRFKGIDHEPRPTEQKGHIPGSHNLPFTSLVEPQNNFIMRPADQIRAAFEDANIDISKPLFTTCGSGVTAAVPAFALYLLGHQDTPVYDGSWAEWGNRTDLPVTS